MGAGAVSIASLPLPLRGATESSNLSLSPDNPEAWYDLSGIQVMMGKQKEAAESLKNAIRLSNERLKRDPKARNLIQEATKDNRFTPIRQQDPELDRMLSGS